MNERLSHKALTEFRDFIAKSWYEVCGKLSDDHLVAGTRVERVRSKKDWTKLSKYVAKKEELQEQPYPTGKLSADHLVAGTQVGSIQSRREWGRVGKHIAKKEELQKEQTLSTGRVWGMWHKNLLPTTWREVKLSSTEAMDTRRVFRTVAGVKRGRGTLHNQQVFLRDENIIRYLDYLGIDLE